MSRKIYGIIKNQSGQPVQGLRVEAWDDDWPDGDDFMGADTTDAGGNYSISYEGGHWDPSPSHRITIWRPDIYVRVLIQNAAGQWVKIKKSSVHENHRLRNDLQIDLTVNVEVPIIKKTRFDPNIHGFKFVNSFTVQGNLLGVDLGTWEMGFCGGMCAGALNRFKNNQPIPPDSNPPAQGTPLFDELRDRQIASLMTPNNILGRIYNWQSAPDRGSRVRKHSVGYRTKKQWRNKLKARLDNDNPTNLVLIRVEGYFANPTKNHQVLAIGYEYHPTTKDLKIQVYDPNHPNQTHTLSMNLGLPRSRLRARDSTGNRLRGFFVNPNGDSASTFTISKLLLPVRK